MQEKNRSLNRIHIWLPFVLATILVVGILIGMRIQSSVPTVILEPVSEEKAGTSTYGHQGKIEQLLRYIEAKYVDEVDREVLVDKAIQNILEELDPHSSYIPADELNAVTEQLQGNFDGIGVEFLIVDDTVVVVTPLSGGPAEKVGILAGDKIVQVEDSVIAGVGITNLGIISLLKGEKGTTVEVGILRGKDREIKKYKITRDEIPLKSVDVSYMLDEQTGLIKINRFAATTDREFIDALDTLTKQGMQDLVIDLRNNPGGYLQKATNMLNQLFRDKGALMVYTQGRSVNRSDYKSTGSSIFNIDKIAVLINENSASAAEIMAGAIQDQDRGIIIGRRSFGKGLVQEQYQLGDGSALRLTVARYYIPSGRSIQKSYDDLEAYKNDFAERYESGELLSENNIEIPDSTRYYTRGGRVVYSGGGIIPDVFVPLDTQELNDLHLELREEIPGFTVQFLKREKERLAKLERDRYAGQFRITQRDFIRFLDFARASGVNFAPTEVSPAIEKDLRLQLKARIGKHLFGDEVFYQIAYQDDDMLEAAMKALRRPEPITQWEKSLQD